MKILVVGAGRIGIRHAEGVAALSSVQNIHLADISPQALSAAAESLSAFNQNGKITFSSVADLQDSGDSYDAAIIATTAANRLEVIKLALGKQVRHLLLEKPLGQSMDEINKITALLFNDHPEVETYVNLSSRLNPSLLILKDDLQNMPQLNGPKTIMVNTGAIGIGANGIHLLDKILFLLDADEATIVDAEIDDTLIPSGRGKQFGDFGGWAVIKFYSKKQYVGKALLSVSSGSTAWGPIEIVGSHGRIAYDEVRSTRTDSLRKPESTLPVYRYHGDYMPDVKTDLLDHSIPELTNKWVESILNNQKSILPTLEQSLPVHKLMFDWLSRSKQFSKIFPIT